MDEPEKKSRIRYASAGNKHIAAAINGLYQFRTNEQALAKLESLKRQFTISQLSEEAEDDALVLWIRDYDLSPEMEQSGYLGNYAIIRCAQNKDEDAYYTLIVERLDRPLKNHPLRKRPVARCPNWGHPILRGVLKGKEHPNLESANLELQQLQLEYPETTVPAQNKLYLMIFSRRDNPRQPIERYVLEIKNLQGGGFIIESSKNTYKPRENKGTETVEANEPMGHFSSMVALKRKKKPGT